MIYIYSSVYRCPSLNMYWKKKLIYQYYFKNNDIQDIEEKINIFS